MAGGEGGFSQQPMGFNKKEVNDYIAKINQRMKEIETEKKANDEKTQIALKKAQDADKKIKAAADANAKQIADLEEQLKNERRSEESLMKQIDDLKLKLKQKNRADAAGAKDADAKAAAVIAKANEQAKNIIDKANATARDTVEKAKAAATKMVTEAQGAGGGVNTAGLDEFMNVLNSFMSKVTSGVNEVNQKASELLGAQTATPVTVPDFSNITAPQAEAPKAANPPKASKASKEAEKPAADDLFALLEDDESEMNMMDDDLEMITEVRPLDDPKGVPTAVVLEEFDLSASADMDLDLDSPVTEVRPLEEKKRGSDHLVDDDFEKQMLAQTANSASLKNELNDDLLASVRQQEEKFAVKPTNDDVGDFSMDMSEDEDPMAAMLRQAELAFGSAAGNSVEEEEAEEEAPAAGGGDNPWAALQNELLAMEKSGDLEESDDSFAGSSAASDPTAPSADDSAIWDFGDDSTSSDDDDMGMSSDLFGNL